MTTIPELVYALQMSKVADSNSWGRYRKAMSASTELTQLDKKREALRLLDDPIAMAQSENQNRWVLTLSHQAANFSRFLEDLPRVKYYYLESLKFNPENPRALSGLADVAKAEGELEVAKEYAARCYKALIEGDDFLKKERLETLLYKWPEVSQY
ncbi:MAG TPA: hypothetical protein VH140_04910 [Candidatus Acidoferrum sp.]|nr:hypothetical protein [Candidatus Acidoferrum sp.]